MADSAMRVVAESHLRKWSDPSVLLAEYEAEIRDLTLLLERVHDSALESVAAGFRTDGMDPMAAEAVSNLAASIRAAKIRSAS